MLNHIVFFYVARILVIHLKKKKEKWVFLPCKEMDKDYTAKRNHTRTTSFIVNFKHGIIHFARRISHKPGCWFV